MLSQLISSQQLKSLLMLILGFGLLVGCATKTTTTGDSRQESAAPVTEREIARVRRPELEAQKTDTTSLEKQSIYTLPPAKQRRAQPEASNDFRRSFRAAIRSMETAFDGNKDFSEALSMFEQLESDYPIFSGPRTNIGMIHLHKQEFDKAEESFLKALAINDENEYALAYLALAYRENGKFQEARESYQKAIELNPYEASFHYNLGVLAELYLQDFPLAIQSFEYYRLAHRQKDEDVDIWLVDLRNRLAQMQPQADQPVQQPEAVAEPTTETTEPTTETTEPTTETTEPTTETTEPTTETTEQTTDPTEPPQAATTETTETESSVTEDVPTENEMSEEIIQ